MQYIINKNTLEYHWDILGELWNEIYDYQNESNVLIKREVDYAEDMRIMRNAQFIRALSNIDHFDDVNEMSFLQSPSLFLQYSVPDIEVDNEKSSVTVNSKDNKSVTIDKSESDISVDEMFLTSLIIASLALNDSKKLVDKDLISVEVSSDENSVNVGAMKEAIFEIRTLIEKVMKGFLNDEELGMLWTY